MVDLNIRFQIASLLVLLVMLYNYMKNKKLPLLSTRFFTILLINTLVYIVFDISTVITVNNMDFIPKQINTLCHQLFLITLNSGMFFLYMYVSIHGRENRKLKWSSAFIRVLPVAVSVIAVLAGKLEYSKGGRTFYSHGLPANTVYICSLIYILSILYELHGNKIKKEKKQAIIIGVVIWSVTACIQLIIPDLLLSGLAMVLMVLFIYLSLENQAEFVDGNTRLFNQYALELMLNEKNESNVVYYVINIVIDDMNLIQGKFGYKRGRKLLASLGQQVKRNIGFWCESFLLNDNSVVLIISRASLIHKYIEKIEQLIEKKWKIKGIDFQAKMHFDIIKCPEFAVGTDELYKELSYMSSIHQGGTVRWMNEESIKNLKRREIIENIVVDAVANDGLYLVYQPIFSTGYERYHSAEALVRLKDTETLGFISPEEFIPIAEEKDLIMELGEFVFRRVCEFSKERNLMQKGIQYIEVNLSGIQSVDANLPKQLQNIMEEYDIPPAFINLEITETACINAGEVLQKNMNELRNMGCSFSMDDFGTGYSNLSQMAEVSYDLVKLDKSLIWPAFSSNGDKAKVILDNVVKMLCNLGVKIVAEGVETQEQADELKNMGIHYLQGYYYSKPVDGDTFCELLSK